MGGSAEEMVEQYILFASSVIYSQCEWWDGVLCFSGHGDKLSQRSWDRLNKHTWQNEVNGICRGHSAGTSNSESLKKSS